MPEIRSAASERLRNTMSLWRQVQRYTRTARIVCKRWNIWWRKSYWKIFTLFFTSACRSYNVSTTSVSVCVTDCCVIVALFFCSFYSLLSSAVRAPVLFSVVLVLRYTVISGRN